MRIVRIVSKYPYRFEIEDDMKCRECGRKRYTAHKTSCSSAKWGRTPEYVSDPSYDTYYSSGSDSPSSSSDPSGGSDSGSPGGGCE